MAIVLASITLPDLYWVDEFAWAPVSQLASRTESGVLVLEESAISAGRPVTLQGAADYGWATRAQVLALYALMQTPSASPMSLLLNDGRSFSVVWRRDASTGSGSFPTPMDAAPIAGPLADPQDTDWYSLTLRLYTVS